MFFLHLWFLVACKAGWVLHCRRHGRRHDSFIGTRVYNVMNQSSQGVSVTVLQ